MEKQKPLNDFVISIAGANIDITVINIEEMAGYCRGRNRLANVVTEKSTYGELDKLNYSLITNYTKPKPRVINTKDKQYLGVYKVLSEKYKSGLLIAEADTLSDPIADLLCNNNIWQKNDVDIIICRDSLKSMTDDEIHRANLLRISADPLLDPAIFNRLAQFYEDRTMAIMLCQYFVNMQYDKVNDYLNRKNEEYKQAGFMDYINYQELNRQLAFFAYFDVRAHKILNIEKKVMASFLRDLITKGLTIIPEQNIEPYCEIICL